MIRQICFLSLELALVWSAPSCATAQSIWTRGAGSPVLTESKDLTRFDSGYVVDPRIVYDKTTKTYFMYYTGCVDKDRINREAIGLATASSLAGPWTKYESPNDRHALLAPGASGDYDYDRNWGQGTILKSGTNFWQMWTIGDSDPAASHIARVGYATSTNGYHWTKYKGSRFGGSIFEDFSLGGGRGPIEIAVLKEGKTYHAWYAVYAKQTIRYVTSANGIDWKKQQTVLAGQGGIGNVVKIGNTYHMTTYRSDLKGVNIYTSVNKTDWTKLPGASLSPSADGWDSERVYYPFLFPASETESYLFYTGANVADDTEGKIGFARRRTP